MANETYLKLPNGTIQKTITEENGTEGELGYYKNIFISIIEADIVISELTDEKDAIAVSRDELTQRESLIAAELLKIE